MSGFDYSKWDNIELSDDESDCHPNIDKASWFRMKHRSRVEREAKEDEERHELEKANKDDQSRIHEILERFADGDVEEDEREALEEEMKELEAAVAKRDARVEEMEKNRKWNVDNMCHVVEERTIIGTKKDKHTTSELPDDLAAAQAEREETRSRAELPPKEAKKVVGPQSEHKEVEDYATFTEKHQDLLEEFSHITDLDQSKAFLARHGDILLDDHSASYLLLACLEDEMNGYKQRMKIVAFQSQILTNINELAVSLNRPPRDVVMPFFARVQSDEYGPVFKDSVQQFIERIQKRAVEKRKEMAAQKAAEQDAETEEQCLTQDGQVLSKEERMGPGGLDPIEVFQTLPEALQEAFESQDTAKLQEAIKSLSLEEAQYHMKRCEDSGLWVKNA